MSPRAVDNWIYTWRDGWAGLRRTTGNRVYGEPYQGFESLSLRQKRTHICLRQVWVLFNEINPLRDLWNLLRKWNTPAACEMPAGVRDLFHFTFRASGKFHNDRRSLFHIRRIFHFTIRPFCCIISPINKNLSNRAVTLFLLTFTLILLRLVTLWHAGASSISLAPTYFISQSALRPLLLMLNGTGDMCVKIRKSG